MIIAISGRGATLPAMKVLVSPPIDQQCYCMSDTGKVREVTLTAGEVISCAPQSSPLQEFEQWDRDPELL